MSVGVVGVVGACQGLQSLSDARSRTLKGAGNCGVGEDGGVRRRDGAGERKRRGNNFKVRICASEDLILILGATWGTTFCGRMVHETTAWNPCLCAITPHSCTSPGAICVEKYRLRHYSHERCHGAWFTRLVFWSCMNSLCVRCLYEIPSVIARILVSWAAVVLRHQLGHSSASPMQSASFITRPPHQAQWIL